MQRIFLPGAFLLSLVVACSGSGGDTAPHASNQWKVVGKSTGLEVSVALAAASLGDENCTHDESTDLATKSCVALAPDAGAPRGTGMCGGPSKFTSAQITFTPGASGAPVKIKVTGAKLVDAASGAQLQALSAYTPLAWDGTTYVAWDETVRAGIEVKSSYTLSPPSWSSVAPGGSYEHAYKVQIVVEIDGNTATLESAPLERDPPVST
jgi:hypothetical protein